MSGPGESAVTSAAAWGTWPAVLAVLVVGLALGVLVAAVDRAVLSGTRAGAGVEVLRSGTRLLTEQRRTTLAPDSLLWRLGTASVPVLALLSLAVVPIGGRTLLSTSADLVWFNAMEAILWAAVWLVGWGPNAVHALTGGYRFLIQGLSYELPLMFALITVGVGAQSLRTTDVVAAQDDLWFIVTTNHRPSWAATTSAVRSDWAPNPTVMSANINGSS